MEPTAAQPTPTAAHPPKHRWWDYAWAMFVGVTSGEALYDIYKAISHHGALKEARALLEVEIKEKPSLMEPWVRRLPLRDDIEFLGGVGPASAKAANQLLEAAGSARRINHPHTMFGSVSSMVIGAVISMGVLALAEHSGDKKER